MSIIGYIKVNRHTKNHGEFLRERDYNVSIETIGPEGGKYIVVECEGFVESLDLDCDNTEKSARLKAVVNAKKLLTYNTTITFEGGKKEKGIKACSMLEQIKDGLSALVANPRHPVERAEKRQERQARKPGTFRGSSTPHAAVGGDRAVDPIRAKLAQFIADGNTEAAEKLVETTQKLMGIDLTNPSHTLKTTKLLETESKPTKPVVEL